jgi:hypothetical protein
MPDINDFPNELITEIFSHFDLKTLTRCIRVSKLFKAITEHSTFDKIFFRTKAIKHGDHFDLDKLQINPIFDMLHYTCRSGIKEAKFLFYDKNFSGKTDIRELALIDSSAAKQNATEPAVTYLYVSPCGSARIKVNPGHAVTVQDVMQELCNHYTISTPFDVCQSFEGYIYRKMVSAGYVLVLRTSWNF